MPSKRVLADARGVFHSAKRVLRWFTTIVVHWPSLIRCLQQEEEVVRHYRKVTVLSSSWIVSVLFEGWWLCERVGWAGLAWTKYVRVIVEWCVTRGCCLQVSTSRCFSAIYRVTSAKASITHKISTHSSTIWKDTCKTRKGSQSSNQTFLVRFLLFLFCCSFRWCLCATAYTTDRWLYAHPLRSSHTTRSLWLIYFAF